MVSSLSRIADLLGLKINSKIALPAISSALFLLILSQTMFAANVTSIQSGNWSNPQIWSGGAIPGASDNVLVDSGHVVQYDTDSFVLSVFSRGTVKPAIRLQPR